VIGSGFPHLEECYRTAELLFPLLDTSGAPRRLPGGPSMLTGGGSLSTDRPR
jgi:hypothetical protein